MQVCNVRHYLRLAAKKRMWQSFVFSPILFSDASHKC